jgi:hypothetical protein
MKAMKEISGFESHYAFLHVLHLLHSFMSKTCEE